MTAIRQCGGYLVTSDIALLSIPESLNKTYHIVNTKVFSKIDDNNYCNTGLQKFSNLYRTESNVNVLFFLDIMVI